VNKPALVQQIVSHLAAELELYGKAARAAHAEATHEQSKAENKYDTRGLEASYLAHGQARQAAEVGQAITQFESLELRAFGAHDPIDLGALVELEGRGERTLYFIGPRAGGTEILHEQQTVLVLTPASPLGRQLVGRRPGERLQLQLGGGRQDYRIVAVT
jgi:transcription elongation GreA/GreB family factor